MTSAHPRLILVCGPSGCGKTTVANELSEALGHAAVIYQDANFDQPFLNYAERNDDSFESPSSVSSSWLQFERPHLPHYFMLTLATFPQN